MVTDSQGKPIIWILVKCVICKEILCEMQKREVVKTPIIFCKDCTLELKRNVF